jgi:hypothetical protein
VTIQAKDSTEQGSVMYLATFRTSRWRSFSPRRHGWRTDGAPIAHRQILDLDAPDSLERLVGALDCAD